MAANKPQIRISKWDEYQHYQSETRAMIWAKLYSKRLANYDLMGLRASTRELSTCLICIAIETANTIPNDLKWLAKRAHLNSSQVEYGLGELLGIGFIEPIRRKRRASNGLAECLPRSRGEEDKPKAVKPSTENGLGFQLSENLRLAGSA